MSDEVKKDKIKVQYNQREWYPIIVPGESFRTDREGKPKEYEVTKEVWERYLVAYTSFVKEWSTLLKDLDIIYYGPEV